MDMKTKHLFEQELNYDKEMMEEYTDQMTKLLLSHLGKSASLENHFNIERNLTDQEISNLRKIAKDIIIKKLQRSK